METPDLAVGLRCFGMAITCASSPPGRGTTKYTKHTKPGYFRVIRVFRGGSSLWFWLCQVRISDLRRGAWWYSPDAALRPTKSEYCWRGWGRF